MSAASVFSGIMTSLPAASTYRVARPMRSAARSRSDFCRLARDASVILTKPALHRVVPAFAGTNASLAGLHPREDSGSAVSGEVS
jgi:hypothetical protein